MNTVSTQYLEEQLRRDLFPLRERLREDWFATELYRALTNATWRRQDGPDGHVSLSWSRAERIVNELREREGEAPLDLAGAGGEGERSAEVADELARLGWNAGPLSTDRHDDAHVTDAPNR